MILTTFDQVANGEFDRFEIRGSNRFLVIYDPDSDCDYWFKVPPLATKKTAMSMLRRKNPKVNKVFSYVGKL